MDRAAEAVGGALTQFVVSNITARNYVEIAKVFRGLRADALYVAMVDEGGRVLAPFLMVLSLFVRTRERATISVDFMVERFSPRDLAWPLLSIFGAIFTGFFSLLRDWVFASLLLRKDRVTVRSTGSRNVLYLKTNLWLGVQAGGSIAHSAGVIGALLKKGWSVDFASAEKPVALPDDPALEVHRILPPERYVLPRELNHYRHNANFIRKARRFVSGSYGFIYQRLSLGNYAGVILSRLMRIPLIIEYNGSEVWLARNWGRSLTFERMAALAEEVCLRHAHLIVTVSDVLREELIDRGVDPERVMFYPNGVEPEFFAPDRFSKEDKKKARERYSISPDATVATFVGTFGQWHGADMLARALRYLYEEHRSWLEQSNLHVMFIGDGVRRAEVENTLDLPGLEPYFSLTGLIDQEATPLYMAASDILMSPHVPNPDGSPFFGSPTKLFEYMAAARPIVASDLDQIGEVMRGARHIGELTDDPDLPTGDQCGVLVTPSDVAELGRAIMFLVDNPDWRVRAGANARVRAQSRYTWGHHIDAILQALESASAFDEFRFGFSGKRPVRALINGLHAKSGGGLTYLRNMLPLMALDPDVDLHLCLHESQRDLFMEIPKGVTTHYLDFRAGFWRLLVNEQIFVPKLASRIGADVVFSPANYGPVLVKRPVLLLRNALAVAFVEHRPVKILYWLLLYFATGTSIIFSREAIAVSEYAKRAVGSGPLRALRDRIVVVPHGVNPLFSEGANGARPQGEYLLVVSDIYVQKNLRNLLLALVHVRRKYPDLKLKVAGYPLDQSYFRLLQATIEQEGLGDMVEFLGRVPAEELVPLYRKCRAFIFPSSVETFGNPLVEAMACGAPIASSNAAAMPEVVGDAALFFDPSDVKEMAGVIERLLEDEPLRRGLSEKAVDRARLFSWEETARKTLAILKHVGQRP